MLGLQLGSFDDVLYPGDDDESTNQKSFQPPVSKMHSATIPHRPIPLPMPMPKLTGNIEQCSINFATKLLKVMIEDTPSESFVVSPYTIQTVFGMCLEGSEALTKTEILDKVFQFGHDPGGYVTKLARAALDVESLRSVVRFYATHRAEFYAEYKKKIRSMLNKQPGNWAVAEVDFETGDLKRLADAIDVFVEKKLDAELMDDALEKGKFFDPNTRLLIVQAFYYDAKWHIPFTPVGSRYSGGLFYKKKDGPGVVLGYMEQNSTFRYFEDENWKVLRKGTSTTDTAVYFVLPAKRCELRSADFRFPSQVEFIKYFKQCTLRNVKVILPKFCIDSPWRDYSDVMKKMGLSESFKSLRANFCYMANVADLENGFAISKLIEKYSFQVDEGVDEDAVDKTPEIHPPSYSEPGKDEKLVSFIADHPFLFFLVADDSSNMFVLLAGRYSGPDEA